ncbi:unnamed protein product, partial [Ectocarpus sp. 12 AP-2014]
QWSPTPALYSDGINHGIGLLGRKQRHGAHQGFEVSRASCVERVGYHQPRHLHQPRPRHHGQFSSNPGSGQELQLALVSLPVPRCVHRS